jgi:ribonuclease HII
MARKQEIIAVPRHPSLEFEQALWKQGCLRIAGLDEAGRGAWAGPVCAAAVILPAESAILARLKDVRDSKQMTPAARTVWAERIRGQAQAWGVGFASHAEIDELGILPATRLAMQRALEQVCSPQHLLIDALHLTGVAIAQTALIKGDARALSIAAASVLAKTSRDTLMVDMDRLYPGYEFARHKGYGTAAHQAALQRLGPSEIHRRSFAPIHRLTSGA